MVRVDSRRLEGPELLLLLLLLLIQGCAAGGAYVKVLHSSMQGFCSRLEKERPQSERWASQP
jgi:hypothetical protein